MSYIGSIDYSGMSNERPDSTKVSHQELSRVHQQQLAHIQERLRDEKQEAVIETETADEARVKDEQRRGSGHRGDQKNKEKDAGPGEEKILIVNEEELGKKLDVSI